MLFSGFQQAGEGIDPIRCSPRAVCGQVSPCVWCRDVLCLSLGSVLHRRDMHRWWSVPTYRRLYLDNNSSSQHPQCLLMQLGHAAVGGRGGQGGAAAAAAAGRRHARAAARPAGLRRLPRMLRRCWCRSARRRGAVTPAPQHDQAG